MSAARLRGKKTIVPTQGITFSRLGESVGPLAVHFRGQAISEEVLGDDKARWPSNDENKYTL
jgi:hypothetical protein